MIIIYTAVLISVDKDLSIDSSIITNSNDDHQETQKDNNIDSTDLEITDSEMVRLVFAKFCLPGVNKTIYHCTIEK
jgi:hypothetical protein